MWVLDQLGVDAFSWRWALRQAQAIESGGRMRTSMFDNGRLVVMLEPGPLNAVKHSKMTRLCHAAQPLCGLQCDGNRLCMRVSCVQL